jgi:hypothetical protein
MERVCFALRVCGREALWREKNRCNRGLRVASGGSPGARGARLVLGEPPKTTRRRRVLPRSIMCPIERGDLPCM